MRISILGALLFLMGGCNTKDQLRTTLMENPDILVDVIKRHPAKFAPIMGGARGGGAGPVANLEEEFKNPKKPVIDSKRAIRGKAQAPITIVAYSDFQCPFCSRAENTVKEVLGKYPNQVKYLFKHFPLGFHAMAKPAALAYEAIALQSREKALKFQDELFANQPKIGQMKEAFFEQAAGKVGADVARMKKDMSSDLVIKRVEADMAEGRAMGVSGTPAFLVNGVFLKGARPAQDFVQIIDRWLKQDPRQVASGSKNN